LSEKIDSLPAKLSVAKLVVPLATKVLGSSNLLISHVDQLTNLLSCSRLDSADRGLIIQSAINQMSAGNKKVHKVLGPWLKIFAETHPDDFKAAMAPLIDTLEEGQIDELEHLIQLSLKVRINRDVLTLGSKRR